MKKNRAVVTVHGREYTLLGEEPTDYMQRVAAYVDRRMSEISFSAPLSEDRLMALTALNLADELLKSKDEVAAMRREMANMRRELAALRKKSAVGAKLENPNKREPFPPFHRWGERLPFFCRPAAAPARAGTPDGSPPEGPRKRT